jgi:hypothetical protein
MEYLPYLKQSKKILNFNHGIISVGAGSPKAADGYVTSA